jgi:choline dehydrogenase-like flavoprotein
MILDARDLQPDQREIETDLCIVGAGPAALVVAKELSSSGARITLLESGGLGYEEASQELNAGRIVGAAYDDLRTVRRRQVGGTVNTWNTYIDGAIAAKYAPLDPIDFEHRDGFPFSGWPFGAVELEPWYRKAQLICGLGAFAYEGNDWVEAGSEPLRFEDGSIVTRVYQFGAADPLLDGTVDALRANADVQLLVHATVTELLCDVYAQHVTAAVVAVSGRVAPLRVRAQTFVLAAGAIENARLLLLSDRTRREGLGNEHGLVGRFFMEHPRDYALKLWPARRTFLEEAAFYDQHRVATGAVIMGRLAIAADALREGRSLQASATLLPATPAPRLMMRLLARVPRSTAGQDDAYPRGAAGWSRRAQAARTPSGVRLLLNLEQAPNPDNSVMLGRDTDALGLRKPVLRWSWTALEQRQLDGTRRRFADALETSGHGRVEIASDGRAPDPNAHHHAGTTRMHLDPRSGVVDASCRVHGVENLFVAGASVFPTAGFVNPTLTIVALAARLADHLRPRFARPARSEAASPA